MSKELEFYLGHHVREKLVFHPIFDDVDSDFLFHWNDESYNFLLNP